MIDVCVKHSPLSGRTEGGVKDLGLAAIDPIDMVAP